MTLKTYNLLIINLLVTVVAFGKSTNSPINPSCEKREFSKNISKEFDQTSNGTTAIYNKYGKVDVKTWSQNKVKIDINIVVNADNQKAADEILNRINVDFFNNNGFVKAETRIEESATGWWGSMNSWTSSTSSDFKINFDVYLPVGNSVDLKNKYGDSFLAAIEGKLTADIKYGDLRSEGIKNDLALELGYGKANFVNAVNIAGSISYGEISVGECRNIALDSKYSDMDFGRANDLSLTSKYDDFKIGTINNLTINSKYADFKVTSAHNVNFTGQYSDISVGWLGATGDFDMSYGSFKLETLDKDFSSLNLDGNYTDFELIAAKSGSYKLDITGNYADMRYPKTLNVSRFDESGNRKSVTATAGDGKSLIKVKLNYGDFLLR